MQCLRCKTEMKQYPFHPQWGIYDEEHQQTPFSSITQKSHNPHSVYVCEECGYMELSRKHCEEDA